MHADLVHEPDRAAAGELDRPLQEAGQALAQLARRLLEEAGFADIRPAPRAESRFFPPAVLREMEPDEAWLNTSLIVEATA